MKPKLVWRLWTSSLLQYLTELKRTQKEQKEQKQKIKK